MTTPLLNLEGIHYQLGERTILDNINLSIAQGQMLTLLGRNGAGKSTLLNCMTGILTPNKGKVRLNGELLSALSAQTIAQNVAYVTQLSAHTYEYRVIDYVVLGRAPYLGVFAKPSEQDFALAQQALERLGIGHLQSAVYVHLSGGEKQLVNIAKALVQEPKLLLFDEPTSALDYGNVYKTLQLIKQLSDEGYAVVITTHNPEFAILLQSEVAILDRGQLACGPCEQMLTQARLSALYQTPLHIVEVAELGRKICAIQQL
ncbi:ABC transporter ATP-binding protein [Pasteurellaceae bacterium TAE3-ERU1]|nr:ABC transporter ATP-binding protein [Pasteurellaceae bacterium TAE3-ERU1]